MSRPKPKALPPLQAGAEAARNASTFEELVSLVAAVSGGPLETFRSRQDVRDAADRRCWELAHRDPRLAARLRRWLAVPAPGATAEERAAWRLSRNFRIAEQIADEQHPTPRRPT